MIKPSSFLRSLFCNIPYDTTILLLQNIGPYIGTLRDKKV